MYVAIDEKVFAEIALREYELAMSDLQKRGWQRALSASQKRHEDVTRQALSGASLRVACRAGCWYCCYYKVDAHAEEVFQIVDYVRAKFSPERAKRFRDEVAANAKTMGKLSHQDKLAVNLKCPFLDGGKCSIYEVRPARCRTFHATDVAGCKKSYEEPTNLSIPNSYVPELFTAGEAHVDGFRRALSDSGYDTGAYELNSALARALTDTTPKRRFDRRKQAFPGSAR